MIIIPEREERLFQNVHMDAHHGYTIEQKCFPITVRELTKLITNSFQCFMKTIG